MESSDQTEKVVLTEMIEVYKSYKLLWDSSQALYFNKDARKEAFACLLDIYKKLKPKATLKEVKKKVENMRSTYKKELKKVRGFDTGTGSQEQYMPTLWYYELMLFLDEKEIGRPGAEAMEEEDDYDIIMNDIKQEPDELPIENSTATLQQLSEPSDPLAITASDSVSPKFKMQLPNVSSQNVSPSTNTHIPLKRAKMSLRENPDAAPALLQSTSNQFDIFGAYVIQQLQMLKPDQQAIAQKLFSDVLFLGKLGQLTPTASVSTAANASHVSLCGPPHVVPSHPGYSQPFERFNHQNNQLASLSDTSPPMSSHGSTSPRKTPSPSLTVIPL